MANPSMRRVGGWLALVALAACSAPTGPDDAHPPQLPVFDLVTYSGLPFGVNSPGDSLWGRYGLTGDYEGVDVKYVLRRLRQAHAKGYALIMAMPRKRQTANHENKGCYSVRYTKASIDTLLRVVPADTFRRYSQNGTLRGYLIMDDMSSTTAWCNGTTVSGAQADSVYRYARQKFPAEVALGIRVQPSWLVDEGVAGTSRFLDFAWLQYTPNKKDQKTWYDHETAVSRSLPHPLKLAYGLNVYNYYRNSTTTQISASDLWLHGKVAVTYPGNCFASFWRYWTDWRKSGRAAVWDDLAQLARQRTSVPSCKAS
jgi:hypothetical protein